MKHDLNISVDFDDEALIKHIKSHAYVEICDRIYKDTKQEVRRSAGYTGYFQNNDHYYEKALMNLTHEALDKFIADNKDKIIELASAKLADRIVRTKAMKAAVAALEETDGSDTD